MKPEAPLRVILVGNYPNDRQESMLRFADCLLQTLPRHGVETTLLAPRALFGKLKPGSHGLGKWLGYLDKFLLFPFALRKALRQAAATAPGRVVVHICDHSNAFYSRHARSVPLLITCHDLLAVRGALGEETDCPPSPTGKILQRRILNGLNRGATLGLLACVSTATRRDVERLVPNAAGKTRLALLGLNRPYKKLAPAEVEERLAGVPGLQKPFLLHVGSNERRKNREGVLRIFQKAVAQGWEGSLVVAGRGLTPELWNLARELRVERRILEIVQPGDTLLNALYNAAFALLFPSRFEGFGWPVIEAQACGCPVVCSASGPLPEVAGEGALLREVDDEAGLAAALLTLRDPAQRALLVEKGLANARRFTAEQMIDAYLGLYLDLHRASASASIGLGVSPGMP